MLGNIYTAGSYFMSEHGTVIWFILFKKTGLLYFILNKV